MKRRVKKGAKVFIAVILIIILVGLILIIWNNYYKKYIKLNSKENEESEKILEKEPIVNEYHFSFIGVGDALIHGTIYKDAETGNIGPDGYKIYDFTKMFVDVAPVIKDYDMKFYNQETIIGGKSLGLSNYPRFNSPDEIGENLIDIGFNVVNLATNHTMDKGTRGALYSAEFWQSKNEVLAIGSYRSFEERDNIKIKEMNGIKYAFLSYTYGTNGLPVEKGYEYLVNVWPMLNDIEYESYKEQVKKDVESVRDKVDILFVSMHFGNEYNLGKVSTRQRDAAEYLASLGVDVIIGTHPHVVEPIEFIGDTLVVYSLGNFISSQERLDTDIGGIVAFDVDKKTVDGTTEYVNISNVRYDLLYTYHNSNLRGYKVIPFARLDNSLLRNKDAIYDEYMKYMNPNLDERIKMGFIE